MDTSTRVAFAIGLFAEIDNSEMEVQSLVGVKSQVLLYIVYMGVSPKGPSIS